MIIGAPTPGQIETREGCSVLAGYAHPNNVNVAVWCPHCGEFHLHGLHPLPNADDVLRDIWAERPHPVDLGHRVAHCGCRKSPHYRPGYFIRLVAPLTPYVEERYKALRHPGRGPRVRCGSGRCRFDPPGRPRRWH